MHDKRTLFTFNGVPVNARPSFWPMWLVAWFGLTLLVRRRHPERPFSRNGLVGLVGLPIAMTADIGHALAHTVSAKMAGAPMDEILLAADMPRTLYTNNQVPPRVHKLRAIGGPVFSAVGLLLSLAWRAISSRGSVSRELADLSCLAHGAILGGSLAPLPVVDGGTLLKWTLVEEGRTEAEAETAMQKAAISLGISTGLMGGLWLIKKFIYRRI